MTRAEFDAMPDDVGPVDTRGASTMQMQVTRKVTETIDVDAIRCVLAVNYEEDDLPNDYPHRDGETWDVTIDVATGQIRDWPAGVEPLDLYMKVVDGGSYYLLSGDEVVASREGEYVPSCIPSAYGDYVDFKIDAGGRIANWRFDAEKARRQFFGDDD